MSDLTRWEPLSEMVSLREAMDRLFNEAFTLPFGRRAAWQIPAVDMYQTDDEVVVKAALPGVKSDEIDISITGDMLTIRGEFHRKEEISENSYHVREQRTGSFERRLVLPTTIVSDRAIAEFEDGILTIKLPKAEEVRPKSIHVKVK